MWLHPKTEDPSKLESMAGVPSGTHEAYLIVKEYCDLADKTVDEALLPHHSIKSSGAAKDVAPAMFNTMLRHRENVTKYVFFLKTGFGEFVHPDGDDEIHYGGDVEGEEAQRILDLNAIPFDAEFTEGLEWLSSFED